MVVDGLPRSYLIQQCRTELNKLCHIDRLPGKQPGAKVHDIRELIKDHVKEYLQENPGTENIQIKINGDDARMTWNSSFVLLSFSILQTGEHVMTAKGNRTIAILNGKEEYSSLKESFGSIFEELHTMIAEGKITVNNSDIETIFSWWGLQVHSNHVGHEWGNCKLRLCMVQHYSDFNSKPLGRSLQEMRELPDQTTIMAAVRNHYSTLN